MEKMTYISKNDLEEMLITEEEFSIIMKVEPETIRTWKKRKNIPEELIFKLPDTKKGTTRFLKDEVIKWIRSGGKLYGSISKP